MAGTSDIQDPFVLFVAPGAGFGHLVRAGALALALQEKQVVSAIVSSSFWAQGFSQITGQDVIFVPPEHWKKDISGLVNRLNPRLLVLDSFPLGFRGESLGGWKGCPVVYLARHLKFEAYCHRLSSLGGGEYPPDMTAIIIEDLEACHQDWLEKNTRDQVRLCGRIRFPESLINAPEIPKTLASLLDNEIVHLVVHSGPEHEVNQLIEQAKTEIRTAGKGKTAVINPFLAGRDDVPASFDYFPASLLYTKAYRVYSGAGYNAVAEGGGQTEKHIVVPFERHYDDQSWRAGDARGETRGDGLAQAVKKIIEILG
nr:hypothetical protein [uncultured Desulfobacter sp.]